MSELRRAVSFGVLSIIASAHTAHAEPAPPPAPYAPPWQLRPTAAASVFRSDTAFAFYNDAMGDGATVVSSLLASYKVGPSLAPFARVAVHHDTPTAGDGETGLSNPLAGVTWAPKLPKPFRLGVIAAVTVPIGTGGGNSPNVGRAAANKAAVVARSSMDNAMFAVNDLSLIAGASIAYVEHGLTLQAEATVFELIRVRGSDVQPDKAKTNFTSGIYAGYFLAKQLSIGGELRYQRYLSTPKFIENDMTGTLRDSLSAAAGVRGHFKLDATQWLRPGIAYARGLDDPMTGKSYQVVQLDVLFTY
jgi:hypothetical protein